MTDTLIEDRWYWVRVAGGDWFPAAHHSSAVGGWSNEDTWEDWDEEIVEWCLIAMPGEIAAELEGL
jgi:hypothetical protein